MLSPARKLFVGLAAIFYIAAGVLHFLRADFYLKIVPPYLRKRPV